MKTRIVLMMQIKRGLRALVSLLVLLPAARAAAELPLAELSAGMYRIEAEVAAKLPIAKAGGGYIYHSDHSIAPGVRWESYQFLMELVDRYGSYR